jgi:hypothetical protein
MKARGLWAALGAAVFLTAGAGVALATGAIGSDTGNNVIVACAKNVNGQLRVVNDPSQCLASEHQVSLQAPLPQGPQNVSVDCTAGQSIQDAIDNAPVNLPLQIGIQGTCTEAVTINRDGVSLNAQSPGDGIRAPGPNYTPLTLNGATHVNLGQLTLTGGQNGLQAFDGASFSAFGLDVSGAGAGVTIGNGSTGSLNNVTIEHSGQVGLGLGDGASVQVFGGTISDSGIDGVQLDGGHAQLNNLDVTRSGFQGVAVGIGSTAELNNTTVEYSTATGVHAFIGGSVGIGNGSLIQYNGQGGVVAHAGAVNLAGADIANNRGAGVSTFDGGRVNMQNGTIIENNTGDGVTIFGGGAVSMQGPNFIRNNAGDGVHVRDTSIALFGDLPSANQIVGNGGWGVVCDGPPAVAQMTGPPGNVSGNGAGQVNCPSS